MKTKSLPFLLLMMGSVTFPVGAVEFFVSPDVPTDDPSAPGTIYLPWEIVRIDSISGAHTPVLSFPVGTAVDALHPRCDGDWLLSVESPTLLAGGTYLPCDLIRYAPAAGAYSLYFCGKLIGIPDGGVVDAAFVEPPGDDGDLILSFDVVVDLTGIGGAVYEPADLVRFVRMAGGCSGWTPVAAPYFDASVAGAPDSANLSGADSRDSLTISTFDVPATLGSSTYLPGELVSWDGAAFGSYYSNPAWRIASRFDAVGLPADPGEVPASPANHSVRVAKSSIVPSGVVISWSAASSAGADDYGIHEGTVASLQAGAYDHSARICTDTGDDLQETFVPLAQSTYYLVTPMNANDEGSYGTDHDPSRFPPRIERPPSSPGCRPTQALGCP